MSHITGVVILNYNNATDTIACVNSLYRHTNGSAYKIVVVDNGSDAKTVEAIDRYVAGFDSHTLLNDGESSHTQTLPFITHLRVGQNLGYAQGNNKGLELLYADEAVTRVMILNNDILLTEDIITPLNKDLDSLPNAAIVTPLLYKRDSVTIDQNCARKAPTLVQIFGLWAVLHRTSFGVMERIYHAQHLLPNSPADERFVRVELPSGSCMLCDKEFFRSIGSFDPNTFLYYEENILWEKIRPLGLYNYLDKSVSCIHLGAATTKTKSTSAFIANALIGSTRYFVRKYTNAGALYRCCLEVFFALFRLKIKTRERLTSKH